MPKRGRGGFGFIQHHQAPNLIRPTHSDRWNPDEDLQSNNMYFFSSASDQSLPSPPGCRYSPGPEHRLLDYQRDVDIRDSYLNNVSHYHEQQVVGSFGPSIHAGSKYPHENHMSSSGRGRGLIRDVQGVQDLDRNNPIGNLKTSKKKPKKITVEQQLAGKMALAGRDLNAEGPGTSKRSVSPNSHLFNVLEGIEYNDFECLNPTLDSGRNNLQSNFANSVAAYQKSMRDMEVEVLPSPQPSVFDRVNMSDIKRKVKKEPLDAAPRQKSNKSNAELEEGELAESGSTNDRGGTSNSRKTSKRSPEDRGDTSRRSSPSRHRSVKEEKNDQRDVRIVRYTSTSPVRPKEDYGEVRRVRRRERSKSKDRSRSSRYFKYSPDRSRSRSKSRSFSRSPVRSRRPVSPRRSPRRRSPRRSPRPSPRRSPRYSPLRTSRPQTSPLRVSSPRRSPRYSPRRSPRRSPRVSPRRSPRRSPRPSPRRSPRRSSHSGRKRSASRTSGRRSARSRSRSPDRQKRRKTSRSTSTPRSTLDSSSISRSVSVQEIPQGSSGSSAQPTPTSSVPAQTWNTFDSGASNRPVFSQSNVLVNPSVTTLPVPMPANLMVGHPTAMAVPLPASIPAVQMAALHSSILANQVTEDSASRRILRGPPALIPVHGTADPAVQQEEEVGEDEETKKRRYQRGEYQKKRDKLIYELFRLQTQQADSVTKHQLVTTEKESKRLEVLIVENAKLQQVITSRVRLLDDLIAKHTAALQEDVDAAKATPQADYFYFDSQYHWCSVCDVVLQKMDAFLLHMHSSQHEINSMSQGVPSFPWHKLRPQDANTCTVQSKRVPFHGPSFLQPIKAWFCRLCETWIGDVNHAKVHLSSPEHNTAYLKYIVDNPDWETNRSLKRQESLKRAAHQKKVEAEQKRLEEEAKKKRVDEENEKNWKLFVQRQATIKSPTVELEEPGTSKPANECASVKSIRLNMRTPSAAKKDDPVPDSSTALVNSADEQESSATGGDAGNDAGSPPEGQVIVKNEEVDTSAQKCLDEEQSVDSSNPSLKTSRTESGTRQGAHDKTSDSGQLVLLTKIKEEKPDVEESPPPMLSP